MLGGMAKKRGKLGSQEMPAGIIAPLMQLLRYDFLLIKLLPSGEIGAENFRRKNFVFVTIVV